MDDEKLEREAVKILFSASAKPDQSEAESAAGKGPQIPFVCPFCNETYAVSAELAGKSVDCRNCREPSRVDVPRQAILLEPTRFSWLGFVAGIALTILIVLLLKWAGVI